MEGFLALRALSVAHDKDAIGNAQAELAFKILPMATFFSWSRQIVRLSVVA